jgi:serine/threonine protein kinase/WD40 repeat protein
MKPERWHQVEQLCQAALDCTEGQRAAFLDRACAGDDALRREVDSLLKHQATAKKFIEVPALEVAAKVAAVEQVRSLVGQKISHYQIVSLLGAGGMGEVYLAKDSNLGRQVALKLLPAQFTQDASRLLRLRRFEQEAKAASALNHPNIVTIHEFGEADGLHFIATEFIDGETLRASLTRTGLMKTSDALSVAVEVASALAAAHEAGIVHRDIKPENVMLRRDGYVKVLDFGLAKLTETTALQNLDSSAPTPPLIARTESGVVLGTAQYMSPEQAAGKKVDARSDIFSFGVLVYEMVTGKRAFRGDSLMTTLAAVINQEPEPLPAKVPPDLARIILRCLRKDPARRYQTVADLKVALEDVRDESISRGQAHALLRRPWTWAVLLSVLVVAGFLGWLAFRPAPPTEPLRAVALTTLPGIERSPSLSPDGNHVVFSWNGLRQDNLDIYVQMIGSDSPLRLTTDPRSDYNPVWSPDGRWIAFFRGQPAGYLSQGSRELLLMPSLGGPERKLADVRAQEFFPTPVHLAWSPDSKALVVTDSPGEGKPDALYVVSLETAEKRQLTNPQPPVLSDASPAVSPDGRSLVFLRKASWGAGELYLLPLGEGLTPAGELTRLTLPALRANYPAWMPDGKEIIFSARGSLWRLAVPGGSPARLPFVGEDGVMPVVSRPRAGMPARLVYVRSFIDENIWRLETTAPGARSSTAPIVAISSTKSDIHCQFSPDGRRVAFTSTRSGEWEIWVGDPDGSNAMQLTFMEANATGGPRWSPDGQLIAFASNLEGEFDIYVVPAAGGKPRRLTSHPALDHAPAFSRDGKWIYFSSTRSGEYRIWKMPASGGDAVQVTPNEGFVSIEAPDSTHLYYAPTSVTGSLWRLPTSGGQPVKVIDGVVWSSFWLLDKGIYYIDRAAGETRLEFFDFATHRPTTVARNLGDVRGGFSASPDGRTILFTRVDSSVDDLMLVENFR